MSINSNSLENVLKAMQIVSEASLLNQSFDKTIVCTILKSGLSDNAGAYCNVTDGSIKFKAYLLDPKEAHKYDKDDQVYVKIPNGDFSETKIIEGFYVSEKTIEPVMYTSPLDTFLDVAPLLGDGSSQTDVSAQLIANDKDIYEKNLWSWQNSGSADDLQVNGIYDTIGLQASFKSLLGNYDMRAGQYGLRLDLYVRLSAKSDKHTTKSVYLDSSEMFGDPYDFSLYSVQAKTFDISQAGTIDGMSLWFYQKRNFEYSKNGITQPLPEALVSNLFVKDIFLAFGSEMTKVQDNTVKLYCTEDLNFKFDNPNSASNQKNLGFLWYNKTEDSDYIGFSDGLVDLDLSKGELKVDPDTGEVLEPKQVIPYDELDYLNQSAQDSRLVEQMAKDTPNDKNGLEVCAAVTEARDKFKNIRDLIKGDLYNTLKAFYSMIKTLSYDDNGTRRTTSYLFETSGSGLLPKTEKLGKDIEEAYTDLIKWYEYAMSAASLVQRPPQEKEETTESAEEEATPAIIKCYLKSAADDKWAYSKGGKEELAASGYKTIEGLFNTYLPSLYTFEGETRTFFLESLRKTIVSDYGGYLSTYDSYNNSIERIIVKLEELFTQLHELLYEKEQFITVSTDEEETQVGEYYYNVPAIEEDREKSKEQQEFIPYTQRDFSHMANRYCVYWYRYNKGHIDEEGLVEDGWERIKPGDYVYNTNSTDSYNIMGYNTGVPLQYKVVDGQVRYVPKAASMEGVVQVYLQPNKEVEKFKIVLFYNHERFESNVLEFTNLDEIPPEVIIDPSDVIQITHGKNSLSSYQTLYGSNNSLINANDSIVNRQLLIHYDGELVKDEALCGAQIFWYVPRNTTMLDVNINQLKSAGFTTDYYRTGIVKSNTLDVRKGPGSEYAKAKEDLTKDTLVYIYDERLDNAGDSWVSLQPSCAIGTGGQWVKKESLIIADYHEAYREGFICFYKTIEFTSEEIKEEIDGKETTRIEKIPKPEDLQFTYRIKEYYVPTSLNNQIFCMVRKGEYQFENFINMTFGTQGTSGTDYTILVQPTIGQRAVTNSAPLVVDVKAFNYDNEELDIHADTSVGSLKDGSLYNPTAVWRGPSTFDFAIDKTTNTVINSGMISVQDNTNVWYCGVAQVSVDLYDTLYGGAKELAVLYPVPWTANPNYSIEGATSVIYDASGGNPSYYKKPYKLFDNGVEVEGITWQIKYFMSGEPGITTKAPHAPMTMFQKEIVNNAIRTYVYDREGNKETLASLKANDKDLFNEITFYENYMPQLDSNTNILIPSNMYISGTYTEKDEWADLNAYPVVYAYKNGTPVWAQPIVIHQNRYPNSMINHWDGKFKIDEENGTILSTMVAAGYKNYDNTYSGVLMGDIEAGNKSTHSNLGIYGYHHGAQSFGFNIDGTAFIGKSGAGRILFDGNKGVIQSAAYQTNGSGMLIDLDDGKIDMKSTASGSKSQVSIQTKASPYFQITSTKGNNLIHIGSSDYYLQSDNYVASSGSTKGSGMKINLNNGHIDANNLKITSDKFVIDNTGTGSFKFNTDTILIDSNPTNGNPYFRIRNTSSKDLIYVSSSNYYLRSSNYSTTNQTGLNFDLSSGAITAYNFTLHGGNSSNYIELSSSPTLKMVAGGKTLMDVSTSNFLLQSSNWGVSGQKAAQFDIKNGKITLRQNAANNNKIVIMDIGAGTYPFQIGSIIPNTADRKFRVSWDGKMFAKDADIEGKVTATSGSISNCTVGNLTANGNIYMGGNTLQFGTSSALNISGGSLRVSGTPFVMGAGASVFEYLNMQAGSNLAVGGTMSFGGSPVAKYDSGTATAGTYYMLNGSAINSLRAGSGGYVNNDTSVSWGMNLVAVGSNGNLYKTTTSANNIWDGINGIKGRFDDSSAYYTFSVKLSNGSSKVLRFNQYGLYIG